jgi:hypothetical protein
MCSGTDRRSNRLAPGNIFKHWLGAYQSTSVHAGIAPMLGRPYTLTLQDNW